MMGYVSFFNHSTKPDVRHIEKPRLKEMHFYALRDIKEGEHIFINYNGDPTNDTQWDFDEE